MVTISASLSCRRVCRLSAETRHRLRTQLIECPGRRNAFYSRHCELVCRTMSGYENPVHGYPLTTVASQVGVCINCNHSAARQRRFLLHDEEVAVFSQERRETWGKIV